MRKRQPKTKAENAPQVPEDVMLQARMDNLQVPETPGQVLTTAQVGSVPYLANFMANQNPVIPSAHSFLLSPLVRMAGAVLYANTGRSAASMRAIAWMRNNSDAIDRLVVQVEAVKNQIPPVLAQRLAALPRHSPTYVAARYQENFFASLGVILGFEIQSFENHSRRAGLRLGEILEELRTAQATIPGNLDRALATGANPAAAATSAAGGADLSATPPLSAQPAGQNQGHC